MIRKIEVEKITDAYYEVERILLTEREMFLTKEEIFMRLPRNDEDIPYITIASLENALRNLARMGHIRVVGVRGKLHYGIDERKEKW
jgi:hypothetical protein